MHGSGDAGGPAQLLQLGPEALAMPSYSVLLGARFNPVRS
jgi:hypothetical protein